MSQKPIVVVGSLNLDLVFQADHIPVSGETVFGDDHNESLGGKGANQAVGAAKLGAPVRMIGCVGNDSYGSRLLDGLEQSSVDRAAVSVADCTTGLAVITRARDGANTIVVIPGANQTLDETGIERCGDIIRNAAILLLQLETPLKSIIRAAQIASQAGVPIILDPAPAQDLPRELISMVTWLTPNESEAALLLRITSELSVEDTADGLLALGVQNVALKLGQRGAFLKGTSCPSGVLVPNFRVNAVDTTAAGDCFNAAFATQIVAGKAPEEAARYANAAAAISVTRHGAQVSMPTAQDVEGMLRGSKQTSTP